MRRDIASIFLFCCHLVLCDARGAQGAGGAPGAPGAEPFWSYAGKTGIGTSYEQYQDKRYGDGGPTGVVSKVWFTIAGGIVTETSYGLIHEAQIRDLQFLVTGNGFFDEERTATVSTTEYLHADNAGRPLSLAYKITNTDREGKYRIEKHLFTDPDRQVLFVRVIFTASEENITPYILLNPDVKATGSGDVAYVTRDFLNAREGHDLFLSLKCSAGFVKSSAGFVGRSDGWQDLHQDRSLDWEYDWADGGNVAMTAQLPTLNRESRIFDIVVGFGRSHQEALSQAEGSLRDGYDAVLGRYNGRGDDIGWEDYLRGLPHLPALTAQTGDQGRLLHASAMALKAMEDKTHAGALIASLSIPWGDTVSGHELKTGYRAVWARDFYQCAMALLALGDTQTPLVSFEYLKTIQVTPGTPGNSGASGWFLQKTHVDGALEWVGVQLDQTAMPVMLGWKLWKAGVLSDAEMGGWYGAVLKPAADFLAHGGQVRIQGTATLVEPPRSPQERWEEQEGYSPSTIAAVIAGLTAAADIARGLGDPGAAAVYELKADLYSANLERQTFRDTGRPFDGIGSGRHYLRVTRGGNPGDTQPINVKNGRGEKPPQEILDAGFLELVRYGVRPANSPEIRDSLRLVDATGLAGDLRVRYDFTPRGSAGPVYPGWRRYSHDGYGERTDDGSNFREDHPANRGRVWPIFTGERGHYELEKAKALGGGTVTADQVAALRATYVEAMEAFANEGLMIPEQVWDGEGSNATHGYRLGEGTNSATPLAWSHAEYVKLVRSLADRNTWDSYDIVRERYSRYGKTLPQAFLRGTGNDWKLTPMTLTADHTWKGTMSFGGGGQERFKFDVYGDWSHEYGDSAPPDGVADRGGADVAIAGGAGSYEITFDDESRAYSVSRR